MNENDRFKAGLRRTESPAASLRSALSGGPSSNLNALRPGAAPAPNLSGLRPAVAQTIQPAQFAKLAQVDHTPVIKKEVQKQVKAEVATQLASSKLRQDLGGSAPSASQSAALRSQLAGAAPVGVASAELRKELTPVAEQSGLFQSIAPLAKVIPVTQQQKLGILSKQLGVFKGPAVTGVSKSLGLKF